MSFIDSEEPEEHPYDFDLIVIGGGSGGLACAKEASLQGKRVACFDYVKPSVQGTKWGLGGTCVNVGCIPKKLMHHSSLVGEHLKDSSSFGWEVSAPKHNWEKLVSNIQDHIASLNWGYKVELKDKDVVYHNALASFVDPHTIEAKFRLSTKTFSARRFVLAVGGRPAYPDIPGAEYAISSDDIFSKSTPPGKTLIVGASYIALECAGFLTGLGFDVTVLVRSIFLRGFDQEIAEMIGKYMSNHGTKFIRPATPHKIEKLENNKLKVTYSIDGENPVEEEFDTVMFATGRNPDTKGLKLDAAGVEMDKQGKVPVNELERTNIPHIYAIGDITPGRLELTPTAIKAGRLLARRLYAGSSAIVDYNFIPTTVFTPIEYGSCGYSEEDASKKFGEENIETFLAFFKPTSWNVSHREDNVCYVKLICQKNSNPPMRAIGWHVLGEEAGEITQGVAVAIKAGATKEHFDDTIGIHPTSAEAMTGLEITRASGLDPSQKGC